MKYKSFEKMEVVKPATAMANNYKDSHMQAKSRSAKDSERLDKILEHYETND